MVKYGQGQTGNFASTGGWTLAKGDAMQYYSKSAIAPLTKNQEDLVNTVASQVYRPCCGNSTAFPDCNHGMALLGIFELMASQGATESQMFQAAKYINSFWFPDTYVEMAVYFQKQQGTSWDKVDPQVALSKDYSSAQGAARINQAIQGVPGIQSRGGSCGA